MRIRKFACGMLAALAVVVTVFLSHSKQPTHLQPYGLESPSPIGPFLDGALPPHTPSGLGAASWDVADAFPNIPLQHTTVISANPDDNRLYVGARDGLIVSFENDEQASGTELFMDLRDRVAVVWDGGFLGMTFHPEFGQSGSPYEFTFYAYYASYCPTDAQGDDIDFNACNPDYPRENTKGFFNTWLRLSRFQAFFDSQAQAWRGDPASEEPMLNIRLYNHAHRGGGMTFGSGGYLYLTIGDQARDDTAQEITNTLEGGTLRLAVDITETGSWSWSCPAGSHQPRRHFQDFSPNADEMSGRLYCIPDDNPWLDPSGSDFEEYFTIGHRAPHRLTYDPLTGLLWMGEVGGNDRDEINVILSGRNYGWPFREGLIRRHSQPSSIIGILQDPVIDFTREEANSVIGGYVYRGTRYPELQGRYIAGDHITNSIWAFTLDVNTMTATKEFLAFYDPGGLATFGQDNQGEIVMGNVGAPTPLQRLERVHSSGGEPPALLSATGAFDNIATLDVHDAAIPYDIVPSWSDGSLKRRWIFLPNDGSHDQPSEQIQFSETGNWGFPVGTVLMKHFELALDESNPNLTARLETRFLVLGEDGDWYGITYRWRDDESDADLLTAGEIRDLDVITPDQGTVTQTWHLPSRDQCLFCHTVGAGGALGPRTHQLNRTLTYPSTGRSDNQLRTWNHLGMFRPALNELDIPTYLAGAKIDNLSAPLELRARSWLDSNCSGCHRQETGNRAAFDARLTTPLEDSGLIWGSADSGLIWGNVNNDLGIKDAHLIHPGSPNKSIVYLRAKSVGPEKMPPILKTLPDENGLHVLYDWIEGLEQTHQ